MPDEDTKVKKDMNDNELIAEFMGYRKINNPDLPDAMDGSSRWTLSPNDHDDYLWSDELEYSTSWDWLMPVVEKIENIDTDDLYFHIIFRLAEVQYFGFGVQKFTGNTKIEATHKAVVEFIKWYNQQKP